MELVREGLNHTLHQVLLGHGVFAHDHDFEDTWQHNLVVNFEVYSVEVRQANNVLTNSDSQLLALGFTLLLILIAG